MNVVRYDVVAPIPIPPANHPAPPSEFLRALRDHAPLLPTGDPIAQVCIQRAPDRAEDEIFSIPAFRVPDACARAACCCLKTGLPSRSRGCPRVTRRCLRSVAGPYQTRTAQLLRSSAVTRSASPGSSASGNSSRPVLGGCRFETRLSVSTCRFGIVCPLGSRRVTKQTCQRVLGCVAERAEQ
jgi:hypothetical protein